jgi:hypothetical protein
MIFRCPNGQYYFENIPLSQNIEYRVMFGCLIYCVFIYGFVAGVVAQLIQELQRRFPEHIVLDALGIIYPQYWLQPDVEITFSKHLKN